MIATATTRARRTAVTGVIALGLAATLSVDIAHATGGSGNSVAARRHSALSADRAYLAALRPVAVKVHDAITPAQTVMTAILEPHAGDAYAARDALVHGDALAGVHAARLALQHLHVPAGMAKPQHDLLVAAKQMENALRRARTWTSIAGNHLFNAVNNFGDGGMTTGASNWEVALNDAYAKVHQNTPSAFATWTHASPSRTDWIFVADRSCSAATYKLGNLDQLIQERTEASIQAFNHHWESALNWLGSKLQALPRPSGTEAVPSALRARLRTLHFNAQIYARMISAIRYHSLSGVERAINQLAQVRATLRSLSSEMNRYGARSCGLIIGQWGGKRLSATGSGSGSSHGSTVNT
jgi:hypothetical protein